MVVELNQDLLRDWIQDAVHQGTRQTGDDSLDTPLQPCLDEHVHRQHLAKHTTDRQLWSQNVLWP
jgi:hypothetical protein